jgi:hypothetical protein
MKMKVQTKTKQKVQNEEQRVLEVQVIQAPTIFWHPSVSLGKLISDSIEHQDSIIVS